MHPISARIVIVGLCMHMLSAGGYPQNAETRRTQTGELIRHMPRAGSDASEAPAEELPSPYELQSDTPPWDESSLFQPRTRMNRYEVWQYYAVGHYGRFRPLVVYSPYDSFYQYDGRPYPWVSTHQLEFMPHAVVP